MTSSNHVVTSQWALDSSGIVPSLGATLQESSGLQCTYRVLLLDHDDVDLLRGTFNVNAVAPLELLILHENDAALFTMRQVLLRHRRDIRDDL